MKRGLGGAGRFGRVAQQPVESGEAVVEGAEAALAGGEVDSNLPRQNAGSGVHCGGHGGVQVAGAVLVVFGEILERLEGVRRQFDALQQQFRRLGVAAGAPFEQG